MDVIFHELVSAHGAGELWSKILLKPQTLSPGPPEAHGLPPCRDLLGNALAHSLEAAVGVFVKQNTGLRMKLGTGCSDGEPLRWPVLHFVCCICRQQKVQTQPKFQKGANPKDALKTMLKIVYMLAQGSHQGLVASTRCTARDSRAWAS